jgi:hypothetical protein
MCYYICLVKCPKQLLVEKNRIYAVGIKVILPLMNYFLTLLAHEKLLIDKLSVGLLPFEQMLCEQDLWHRCHTCDLKSQLLWPVL